MNRITHLYNTGSTNGKDGKIIVLRQNGERQRVWLHHGNGMQALFDEVKHAVEVALLNPMCKVNCDTLEVEET